MMENNIIPNALLLVLMLDAFIYLLVRAWQVHIIGIQTTALQDKLVYSLLGCLGVWSFIYLGNCFDITTPVFRMLSYLGGVGLFVVAYVVGLMAHDLYKETKRKAV